MANPFFRLWQSMQLQSPEFQLQVRKDLIWAYSWAIPSPEAIALIARHSPVVEMGAGAGYWTWLLRQAGAQVVAYDQEPNSPPRWTEVLQGGPEVLSSHSNRTLLLCWPPYETSMAREALNAFHGSLLIYIGEWKGRTACARFHAQLDSEWDLVESLAIPQWPGFHDRLHLLRRTAPRR